MSFQPSELLCRLVVGGVDFVHVGGMAGVAHGSSYLSYDIDIVYERSVENLERLATVLAGST